MSKGGLGLVPSSQCIFVTILNPSTFKLVINYIVLLQEEKGAKQNNGCTQKVDGVLDPQ